MGSTATLIPSGEILRGSLPPTLYWIWVTVIFFGRILSVTVELQPQLPYMIEPQATRASGEEDGFVSVRLKQGRTGMSVCTGSLRELPLMAPGTQNSSVITWLRMTRPAAGQIVICSCHLAWADPRIVLPSGSAGHKVQKGLIIPCVSWDLRHFLPRRWDYCYKISVSYPRTYNVTLSLIIPYVHLDLCPEGSDVNGTRALLQNFQRHIISPWATVGAVGKDILNQLVIILMILGRTISTWDSG